MKKDKEQVKGTKRILSIYASQSSSTCLFSWIMLIAVSKCTFY